jgi:hypothetical protein
MSLTDSNKKKNYSNVTNGNTKVAELPKSKMKDKIKVKKIKIDTTTLVKDGNEGVGGIIKSSNYKNFKDYLNKKKN